ncbi:MAG: InlB B-repeat-containing protein [Paludibacteraceae bacterium]|nr:InlB B-repeat-containing protein [Paludibacteraceae bacterium]
MKNIYKYVFIAFLLVIGCNSIKANDWACTHYDLNTLQYNGWDDGVSSCTKLLYMQFRYTYQTYNRYYLYLEFSLSDDNWRNYNDIIGPKPGKYYFGSANGSNWCSLQNKALAYSSQYSDYSSMAWNDHYYSSSGWKRYASWQFDGTGEDCYILVEEGKNGNIYMEVHNYESGWGNVDVTIGEKNPNQVTIPLTTNLERKDNTQADNQWKYLQLSGTGTGSDNKNYNVSFYIKSGYKTGTFGASDLDKEQTHLVQNGTTIGWSDVTLTVTETSTDVYNLTATFTGVDGIKYFVTADYKDDCATTGDEGTQGSVPCTAYFTLDQMSITSRTTLGNALCNADWKTPNGWSKTFTVLQASSSDGTNVKLFFSNISTQTYNGIVSPVARDYAFANAGMDQDYTYLAETNCFNPIGNENLYYYGFIYDENGTMNIPVKWYDYDNVAVGQGSVYYGDNAWFPGGNSDPDNDYVIPEYHQICPYWSIYTCPDGESYYFNSSCVVHVEQKADGNVFIQVRDKEDASAVYVQIGTTTVDQGGSGGGGGDVTPTIKFDTYVNGHGSVTVSPEECLYAVGATITLTPVAETDWTFTGWTGDCANQIEDNHNGTYTYTVPANDCSVIANFEEGNSCTYNVSFDANGGNGTMETQTFNCGVGGKLNPIGFTGPEVTVTYNYHGATSGNSTPSVTVNKPFDIWEDNKVNELHDDEEDVDFSVSNGETVTMTAQWRNPSVTLPTPEKTGFTFNGWYTEETGGTLKGTGGANVIISGDITLHAQWTANGYTIRFENHDGELLQESEMSIGSIPSFGGTPERQNEGDEYNYYVFTFTGWADSENNTYAAGIQLPAVTQNATYTAQYSEDLYINLQEKKDADYYTNFSDLYNGKKAATATLERTFTRGQWATLCLPFNVTAGLMGSIGMTGRVFEFSYAEGNLESGITLYFSQAKKIDAGKGYIVNANTKLAQKDKFVFPGVTVKTDADIASSFNVLNLEGHRSSGIVYLVGTLRTGTVKGTEGNGNFYFGLSNNTIKKANETEGTKLLAYRGIFRSTESLQTGCRVRIVAESEDGQIVGELEVVDGELEDVNTPKKYMQNGILYIERNGVRYTAEGQKVE